MKKTFIFILFYFSLISSIGFAIANDSIKSGSVVIAGGNPFGLRFSLAGGICSLFYNKDCMVKPTRNSAEAIELLQAGMVNFSLVQSDWLAHARNGTSRFSSVGKSKNLTTIQTLLNEDVLIIVGNNSGINKLSDLKKKKLDVGVDATYRSVVANVVLDSVGLDIGDVKIYRYGQDDALTKLCANKIDATVLVLPNPNTVLETAIAKCNVKIIGLSDKQVSFVGKNLRGFVPSIVSAQTYWEQDKDIKTVALQTSIIVTKDSDPKLLEMMKNLLQKNRDKIAVMHPVLFDFKPK